MHRKTSNILAAGFFLLLLVLAFPGTGNHSAADSASGSAVQVNTISAWVCLPQYSEPEMILTLNRPTDLHHMVSADFNDDGWADVVLARAFYATTQTYELDILLNDGSGSLVLGTSQVFSGTVPSVMDARELVLADFNGDDRPDIFIADEGMDAGPNPGYQNTLVLSAPGGKMVDATGNLPQQSAMTHSAAAADIDGDEDVDLYIGNFWGQNDIDPQILINDGNGMFSIGENRLPPLVDLNQNGYTTCEFVDVNNDGAPDLVLGDADDVIANEHSTPDSEVLLNDGTGHFSLLANAIPSKPFTETDIALDIDATDINGDGYQDLLMVFTKTEYAGRYIQILINNQDGTFRNETATRLPQFDNNDPWIKWVYLLDLDMDGHLDIVAAPNAGPEPLFYLNNGDGTFRALPNVFNISSGNLFAFFDIDQDGYLDVLWSYGGCQQGACPEEHFLVRALGCPMFLPFVCLDW